MKNEPLKCSDCGKFVSYDDLELGKASREMVCPEPEDFLTLCPKCFRIAARELCKKALEQAQSAIEQAGT